MEAVLIKAFGFLFMIALGFTLKKIGLFSLEDSGILSKLVLKITLPMSIVSNFRALELTGDFLVAIGIGFLVHIITIVVILLLSRKKPPAQRAFYIINASGYNIGLCTLPYLSGFFAADAIALHALRDLSADDSALHRANPSAGCGIHHRGHDRAGECFFGDAAGRDLV